MPDSVALLDLTDQFCNDEICWAVKDGVAVYRDSHHITATYAERISPTLRDAVNAAIGGKKQVAAIR